MYCTCFSSRKLTPNLKPGPTFTCPRLPLSHPRNLKESEEEFKVGGDDMVIDRDALRSQHPPLHYFATSEVASFEVKLPGIFISYIRLADSLNREEGFQRLINQHGGRSALKRSLICRLEPTEQLSFDRENKARKERRKSRRGSKTYRLPEMRKS